MNFFGYQEQARRNTLILVAFFCLSVGLIVFEVYVAVWLILPLLNMGTDGFWNLQLLLWVGGIASGIIVAGSLYRMRQLSEGGGAEVALMLGGTRLPASTQEQLFRRLLNVVEEMAIASGLPVPPVYMLPHAGINAFAAGFTPSDAVIGITHGAVELLSRDQLQGVIAHEFSHILNGDSAMKMRMLGVLFGIEMIGDVGITLMTFRRATVRYRVVEKGRKEIGNPYFAIVMLGLLLFAIGTVGMVCADFIKRAVSRQREFLADAAAVQFTRNPEGIAEALKLIGGYAQGSRVNHPAVHKANHFFFGDALKSWYVSDWWATHPPLEERIRRIEPGFRGKFEKVNFQRRAIENSTAAATEMLITPDDRAAVPNVSPDMVLERVGAPDFASMQEATLLMAKMPVRLREFAHDPYTARATVYALLLNNDVKKRKVQIEVLQKSADPNVFRETLEIQPLTEKLKPELRLPLAEMVLPALKEMSAQQFAGFEEAVTAVIRVDNNLSLFEFALYRMVIRRLKGEFAKAGPRPMKYTSITPLLPYAAVVLALVARTGHGDNAPKVFEESIALLEDGGYLMPDRGETRLSKFDKALTELNLASPQLKESILRAVVHCVVSNGVISVREGELLRIVADGLDCPLPPLASG